MTMILTSVAMVGWADVPDSNRGDFRHRHAVDISTGCPAVREKSGKFQTWQKSGKSQGILLKAREKMNKGKVREFAFSAI